MINNGISVSRISINKIDFNNAYYKISRKIYSRELENSILNFGILTPPLLLSADDRYTIISGHNRLKVLEDSGGKHADAIVMKKMDRDLFTRHLLLKCHDGGAGIMGKARFLHILKNDLETDPTKFRMIAKQIGLPLDSAGKPDVLEKIINLPQGIRDYADLRDMGYKIIRNILRLPDTALDLLNEWITRINMRINIFKGIVELLLDLSKKDKNLSGPRGINTAFTEDRREKEVILHDELYKMRYPEYTKLRSAAEGIVNEFSKQGIEIDFPKYMEGDEIGISFKISKREGTGPFIDKLSRINAEELKKLLELL